MSKISLAPDASGTGIFTIASPNSNTNRTLTLPDDTGTIVTNSGNQAGSFTTLNTSGQVVFNDAGADVDFRVEGDTDANLLFVDASTDRVGVGINNPSEKIHTYTASGGAYNFVETGNASNVGFRYKNSVREYYLVNNSIGTFDLYDATALATRLIVDTSGNFHVATNGQYVGMAQYNNKKWLEFDYPDTVGDFGYLLDCTNFYTAGNGSGAVQMRITESGDVGCRGSFSNGQQLTDYAEYFEWSDGNPNNEERIGTTVILDGNKIRPSTESDAQHLIIGVVSATAGVILGSAPLEWAGKFQKDEFGRTLTTDVVWVHWMGEDGPQNYKESEIPDDVVVPEDAEYRTYKQEVLSEGYDDSIHYVNREARPEWACIGLMGQVRIRKGQPVGDRWIKMRDVSETVEEWIIR